jgi:hypothetical protein
VTGRTTSITVYVTLSLALALLAVAARRRPDVVAPLGVALRRAAGSRAGQLLVLLVWWWLGWHFVVDA